MIFIQNNREMQLDINTSKVEMQVRVFRKLWQTHRNHGKLSKRGGEEQRNERNLCRCCDRLMTANAVVPMQINLPTFRTFSAMLLGMTSCKLRKHVSHHSVEAQSFCYCLLSMFQKHCFLQISNKLHAFNKMSEKWP